MIHALTWPLISHSKYTHFAKSSKTYNENKLRTSFAVAYVDAEKEFGSNIQLINLLQLFDYIAQRKKYAGYASFERN